MQLTNIVSTEKLNLVVVLESVGVVSLVHTYKSCISVAFHNLLEIPDTSPLQMRNGPGHHRNHQVMVVG